MVDYFSFYGLPLSFNPDLTLIKQQFYTFSKKYHPDFYINESEEKQTEVLELSTVNNQAYKVLSDPQRRLKYVLELKGLLKEGENYTLPQNFLMEMMEVNEALMDLQLDPNPEALAAVSAAVEVIRQDLTAAIDALTNDFDNQDAESQEQSLTQIKDLYYRNQYLLRIEKSIQGFRV